MQFCKSTVVNARFFPGNTVAGAGITSLHLSRECHPYGASLGPWVFTVHGSGSDSTYNNEKLVTMPVFLPGGNDSSKGHLEKSTEQHKKRQIVKRQASPLNQRVGVRRRKKGRVRVSMQVLHPVCAKKLST